MNVGTMETGKATIGSYFNPILPNKIFKNCVQYLITAKNVYATFSTHEIISILLSKSNLK